MNADKSVMRPLVKPWPQRLFLLAGGVCLSVYGLSLLTAADDFETGEIITIDQQSQPGGLAALPSVPEGLPAERVALGRDLFGDRRLSLDRSVSCASCHDLTRSGADTRAFSVGIAGRLGEANAPTVFNASLNFRQFWNGRAATLKDQVSHPLTNAKEMGMTWAEAASRLNGDDIMRRRFLKAYGAKADADNVADAIAAFEKTLLTPGSAFDRYLEGEKDALSAGQLRGFEKFKSLGCIACHQGVNLGGNMYQTFGIMGDYFKDRGRSFPSDLGRFAVTGRAEDMHVFRVPSLRNVELTAPYFHDGQTSRLQDAVKTMAKYQLGLTLREGDVSDLTEFLKSLTGQLPATASPRRPADETSH